MLRPRDREASRRDGGDGCGVMGATGEGSRVWFARLPSILEAPKISQGYPAAAYLRR